MTDQRFSLGSAVPDWTGVYHGIHPAREITVPCVARNCRGMQLTSLGHRAANGNLACLLKVKPVGAKSGLRNVGARVTVIAGRGQNRVSKPLDYSGRAILRTPLVCLQAAFLAALVLLHDVVFCAAFETLPCQVQCLDVPSRSDPEVAADGEVFAI